MSSINSPQLHKLWTAVQTKPEWATTKFWEYVFKQNVFTSRQWVVASQQPPTDDESDLRRVDLVVENIDDSAILLFMEAKRADATRDQIQEVEYQAFTACCANLYATSRRAIWAMTCVGTKARLWAYKLDADYITPFWPLGDGLAEKGEYVDFSTHGKEILDTLEFIKRHPIPDKKVFANPPSPRPAHPVLPVGWHDNEVAFIASASTSLEYAGPSGSDHQMPDYASVNQSQQETAFEGLILDASQCFELVVDKLEGHIYKCNRLIDGGRIHVADGAWVECGISVSGQIYPGYSWTASSGTQYFTWSLESERKRGKKTRK